MSPTPLVPSLLKNPRHAYPLARGLRQAQAERVVGYLPFDGPGFNHSPLSLSLSRHVLSIAEGATRLSQPSRATP